MDDMFFLVFVQCVARRALSGFCVCFVLVDLCSGWGVVILLAVSFVDLFLFVLFVCSVALPLYFFVCLLLGEVGFVWPRGVTRFVIA